MTRDPAVTADEPTQVLLAARVALIALRSAVDPETPLTADRVLLSGTSSPVSSDEAARVLAAKPKPLFCDAKAHDGMLVVGCRSPSDADAQHHEWQRRDHDHHGGFMGYLQDSYGPGDHLVAVFGREDSLILPHSVLLRWLRDYEIGAVGYSSDDVDNPWEASNPEYLEAKSSGAKGVLRFSSPVTYTSFSVTTLHTDGDNAMSGEAEQQLVQMARMSHMMLRSLIDSASGSTPPPGDWNRKLLAAATEYLTHTVKMMKEVFKGRSMPRDVAAFVEDCDKHLGSSS